MSLNFLINKMIYFYDTYALIEIFNGNPKYKKFEDYKIYTSIMNFYEFYYSALKEFNEKMVENWRRQINLIFIKITEEDIVEASKFRLKNIKERLSYIDCLGYALALNNNMKFLTGDEKFENKRDVEFAN